VTDGARVAVVIPARDEERLLPRVLAAVPPWVSSVVPVDDGSRDRTWDVIRAWHDPRALPMRLSPGRGVGAAIVAGYARALEIGAEVVAVVAADAQMDLAELETLVRPIARGAADYVQGNRFRCGRPNGRMPLARRWGNALLSASCSWAAGARVGDSQCGFTAAGADFLGRLDRRRLPPGYGFPAFLRLEAQRMRARVVEVPVRALYGDEVSGIRPLLDPPWICARILWRGIERRLEHSVVRRPPVHAPAFGSKRIGEAG